MKPRSNNNNNNNNNNDNKNNNKKVVVLVPRISVSVLLQVVAYIINYYYE